MKIHAQLIHPSFDLRLWFRVKEEADAFRELWFWAPGPYTNLELECRGTLHYFDALASTMESNTDNAKEHADKASCCFKILKNKKEDIPDMFVGQRKQLEDLHGRISTEEVSDDNLLRGELLLTPNTLQWKALTNTARSGKLLNG